MSFAGRLTLAHPWFVALVAAVGAGAIWYAHKQQQAAANAVGPDGITAATAANVAKTSALIAQENAGIQSWRQTEHDLIQSGAALYQPFFFPDNTDTLQQPASYNPSLLGQIFGD